MVNPKLWGGAGWYLIHSLRINYVEGQHLKYQQLLFRLSLILPCAKCRAGFVEDLKKNPLGRIVDRASLMAWSLNFHNATQRRSKQPAIAEYKVEENTFRHEPVIQFLAIAAKDAAKNPKRTAALVKFVNLYAELMPCLTCRQAILSHPTPYTVGQVIGIIKKHK